MVDFCVYLAIAERHERLPPWTHPARALLHHGIMLFFRISRRVLVSNSGAIQRGLSRGRTPKGREWRCDSSIKEGAETQSFEHSSPLGDAVSHRLQGARQYSWLGWNAWREEQTVDRLLTRDRQGSKNVAPMTILVVGASRFLGTRYFLELSAQYCVLGTDFPRSASDFMPINTRCPKQVISVLNMTRPDVLIDFGAMTRPDACEREQQRAYENHAGAVKRQVRFCNCKALHCTNWIMASRLKPAWKGGLHTTITTSRRLGSILSTRVFYLRLMSHITRTPIHTNQRQREFTDASKEAWYPTQLNATSISPVQLRWYRS